MKLIAKVLLTFLVGLLGLIAVVVLVWEPGRSVLAQGVKQILNRIETARLPAECRTPESQFVWKSEAKDKKRKLLVFVHGISGNALCTWEVPGKEHGMFPLLKKQEDVKKAFDIYSFGYPAGFFDTGAFTIVGAAKRLNEKLRDVGKEYSEIIIVAHSMGGLVALEALTTESVIAEKVTRLFTYSTPYDGAEIAELAQKFLPNPSLGGMQTIEYGNDLLASLRARTSALKRNSKTRVDVAAREQLLAGDGEYSGLPAFEIECAGETLPVPQWGKTIVDYRKSTSMCEDVVPLHKTHLDITIPDSVGDEAFDFLLARVRSRVPVEVPLTMTVYRQANYEQSTCGSDGVRKFHEVLHDSFTFSRNIKAYSFDAYQKENMELQVVDKNGEAFNGTERPCPPEICGERGSIRSFQGAVAVVNRRAELTWTWTSPTTEKIEGLGFAPRLPLTRVRADITLPADMKFNRKHGFAVDPHDRLVCTTSEPSERVSSIDCEVKDGVPLQGRVTIMFDKMLDGAACPEPSSAPSSTR